MMHLAPEDECRDVSLSGKSYHSLCLQGLMTAIEQCKKQISCTFHPSGDQNKDMEAEQNLEAKAIEERGAKG